MHAAGRSLTLLVKEAAIKSGPPAPCVAMSCLQGCDIPQEAVQERPDELLGPAKGLQDALGPLLVRHHALVVLLEAPSHLRGSQVRADKCPNSAA